MSWVCELSKNAERDLKRLPKIVQKRVASALQQMESDPFRGDVRALEGPEWKGVYRKRIGGYRLLFTLSQATKTVVIVSILLRSEKTYRKG